MRKESIAASIFLYSYNLRGKKSIDSRLMTSFAIASIVFNFGREVDADFFFLVGLLFFAFLSCADSMSLAMSRIPLS